MSSTTSSDCESCDCSQCTYSFENNHNDYGKLMTNSRHVPIYATMAHPLIYYAQVQQPKNKKQANDQPRKDNPFKKAFKWYTQERGRMLSNKTEICPEKSGFADWLDNKYYEYLREGGTMKQAPQPTTHESRTQKNSIAEQEICPGASKQYGRLKSPWSKRRRSVNDGGDVPEKGPCGSCEYILKPKDLTRATSEHTPTSGGKSNATVISSNMPCNVKCSGRSHSLSDVGREKSVPRHGDTVTHIAQGPRAHEQDLTKMLTKHQEQEVQVPFKSQEPVTCKCPRCLCPPDEEPKVPEVVKQVQPCCLCPQKKIPKVEKLPSKTKSPEVVKQDPTRLPCCLCPQDNAPQVEKLPSKSQQPTYPPLRSVQVQEKLSGIEKVPSKTQDQKNQPIPQQETESELVKVPSNRQYSTDQAELCCKCNVKKVPEVVKIPSIKQVQPCCLCSQENIPKVEKVPSKTNPPVLPQVKIPEVVKPDPTRLPCCWCPQDNAPQVEKIPSKSQEPTYPPLYPVRVQEKLSGIEKVPSKARDLKNQPIPQQETESELMKVPSKAKERKSQPIPQQEKVPEVVKVPSKGQNSTDRPGPCCKCNLKKVPEVVQVPSQSRAVQESCQVPEDKVVPVNEGTQYEPSLRSPRSTQNVRPCCCNTCNPPFPPNSPIICLPVKVQSSKISNPETYLIASSAISDAPKKQKKTSQRRSVSCQFDEGNKSKVDTQCEHQNEPCICSKPYSSNCHSVNQVSDPVPIRRQSHSTVAISEETGECGILREVAVVNKVTRSVTCASNDAAQTSDHSICFDKDGVCSCQCPLFLKIIYADIKE